MNAGPFRVFVAAPFTHAPRVRNIHDELERMGYEWTSSWAAGAHGAEDFSQFTPDQLRAIAYDNDADVMEADFLILLAEDEGRESYAEARYAQVHGIPVIWLGRPALATYRDDVYHVPNLDAAYATMTRLIEEGEV